MNQWILLELLTGIWVRCYWQEQKWLTDSCITKDHIYTCDSPQNWEPKAHCAACWLFSRLESFPSWWLIWSKSLPCSWAGFWFFQAVGLVSESSLQLVFSEGLEVWLQLVWEELLTLVVYAVMEGLVIMASFRNFLRPFELFTFLLEELPWKVECFSLVVNCYTS